MEQPCRVCVEERRIREGDRDSEKGKRIGRVAKKDWKEREEWKREHETHALSSLSGVSAADYATAVSAMPEEEAAMTFVAQLDEIFGTEDNPSPASSCLDGWMIHDWAKVPTIMGGYR